MAAAVTAFSDYVEIRSLPGDWSFLRGGSLFHVERYLVFGDKRRVQLVGSKCQSRWVVRWLLGIAASVWMAAVSFAGPAWIFNPQKAGRALYEGGWMEELSLGSVNGSPEFSFPLQLIYLNARQERGMFGPQWFCPQLESTVLPKGQGVLVWSMPSGGLMAFRVDTKRTAEFLSLDGNWRAKVSGSSKQLIYNDEGWQFSYSRGKLESISSPTGRVLELQWSGNTLQTVQIRDTVSGARRVLVGFAFGAGGLVSVMQVGDQQYKFGYYRNGGDDRLAVLAPPLGNELRFFYQSESGILERTQTGKGDKDVVKYASVFVTPFEGTTPSKESTPKANPKNYWIAADRDFDYSYGIDPKNKARWLADQVSLAGKTGLKKQVSYSGERGIVAAKQEGVERKLYYYRAPGQKYDGKLRRVEENGLLKAEYRYDRKTGLMTEMVDGQGTVTFYDYPEGWKPLRRELWEPKPVRIRRGSRAKNETVAEFAYDDLGRIVTAKDAAGNVTRYGYTGRGELGTIIDPEGGKTVLAYDEFGRRTSVTRNNLKESVEYDPAGHVSALVAADGSRTEMNFDKTGQISGIKRNGKLQTEYVRDAAGKIVGEKDALGRVKKLERDERGNLLAETAANGSVTHYEYDDQNRCVAQIDGNGNKITFAYDLADRLVKQVNALGGTLTWKYDPQGKLVERTNGEQSIAYTYTKEGKLAKVDYGAGQTVEYLYDKEGRLESQATPETGVGFTYDKLGRLETARHLIKGGHEHLLRYRYDARGRRTGLLLARLIPEIPSTGGMAGQEARYEILQQTEYTYEGALLSAILSNGEPVVSYQYDSTGKLVSKTFGNGMKVAVGHDSMGRLSTMEFSGGPLPETHLLAYEWDAGNQVTSRAWHGEVQRYEYDPSGQLLKATEGKTARVLEAYAYDKAGNMTEKTIDGDKTVMTYNGGNQLATLGKSGPSREPALSFSYDRAGRLIGPSGGDVRTYGWLDKVTNLSQPGGAKLSYLYWPDGQISAKKSADSSAPMAGDREIKKIAMRPDLSPGPSDEIFLWDGLALLLRNDTVYVIEPHASGGVPIASAKIGAPHEVTYFLNDMLGTTLATLNKGVIRYEKLTAFGQDRKPLEPQVHPGFTMETRQGVSSDASSIPPMAR